jgi:sterol desaturase/sphingolipid hydroxylase (fatty acid hydroxylase superfamily)
MFNNPLSLVSSETWMVFKWFIFSAWFKYAAAMIEAFFLTAKGRFSWKECAVSVVDSALRKVKWIGMIAPAAFFIDWSIQHQITTVQMNGILPWVSLFLVYEFCYYWMHRIGHDIRWFWTCHEVHHSTNKFNLSADLRIGLGKITGVGIPFVLVHLSGFPLYAVAMMAAATNLLQFVIHVEWVPKLGFLEGTINTPSAHRVHHASNLEYLDKNHGGMTMIWDHFFGTYMAERDDVPCVYGLVKPVTHHNPIMIHLNPWISLAKDLKSSKSFSDVFGYLFKPPGWSPTGDHQTSKALRQKAGLEPAASSPAPSP